VQKMTFVEHLADLRKRLIYVLLTFAAMFAASLGFISRIYRYLTGPVEREGLKLMVISPGEVIAVYFLISVLVAVGLTLPFALYHVWRFVAPGLTPIERRYTLRLLPVALVMFVLGVAFAWFLIFPTIFHFLIRLSETNFNVQLRAEAYFGFITDICLPFGFIFELPIVVVFLTRIGVIGPGFLRRIRRYAYFVCAVVGVLISPPELVSHLSVVLPMIALYEVSILLSALVRRRQQARQEMAATAGKNGAEGAERRAEMHSKT
jgi:sec-independent protein translocase protein TatC